MYVYKQDVLDALLGHGVRPTGRTSPDLVHEFVSDLYRYEIRRLRDRLLRREFPKPEYFGRVVDLRKRYGVISVRARDWLER
jgi:hypothetical protein